MNNAVLFPLKTNTVYSKDSKETFETLDRLLKNSLLFFEEIWIETGIHEVTYGDTFGSAFNLPYKGIDDYKKTKKAYEAAGAEKRKAFIAIQREGKPNARISTIASSPARSYFVSLQGAFECLFENYSGKELEFIKFFWVKDSHKFNDAVSKVREEYTRIPNIRDNLQEVCEKWDIGNLCTTRILEESISATVLSRACNSPPIIDELHKDVIGSIDNIKKKIHAEQLRIDTLSKIMKIAIPDYSDFPLSKILDLRQEPSLKEFRRTVTEITRRLDGIPDEDSYAAIFQEINKRLIKDVKSIAPKGKRNVILSAAADCLLSIPFSPEFTLPLLLASLGKTGVTAIGDFQKKDRWNNSFGCFWMKMTV